MFYDPHSPYLFERIDSCAVIDRAVRFFGECHADLLINRSFESVMHDPMLVNDWFRFKESDAQMNADEAGRSKFHYAEEQAMQWEVERATARAIKNAARPDNIQAATEEAYEQALEVQHEQETCDHEAVVFHPGSEEDAIPATVECETCHDFVAFEDEAREMHESGMVEAANYGGN